MAATSSSRALPPVPAEVLNLRGTPAVVEWHDTSSQHCYLAQSSDSSPIHLSLFFDSPSSTAFFKLRAAVVLEGSTPQDEVKTYVYLFIPPEQVLSLVSEEVQKLPESTTSPAARLSCSKLMCLRFVLSKCASVVAAADISIRPKSTADSQILGALDSLMQQNAFAIYISLDALPNSKRLQSLCRTSSNGSLRSHPKHAGLSSLYGGRGGRVVEPLDGSGRLKGVDNMKETLQGEDAAAEDSESLAIPPSYAESGLSPLLPAPAPLPAISKKRRRVSFESAAPAMEQNAILDMCGKLLARQQAEMHHGMFARMDEKFQQMEARLMRRIDERLDERLDSLKSDIYGQVEERMDARIDEVTGDVDGLIDERIEDSVLGIKLDLESFVKDEVRNVEDDIRDDLQRGSFSIQFNR